MSWVPDDVVVDAVLAGRLSYSDLGVEDARWVVATLTHRGVQTGEIAVALRCSRRTVQRVKRDPMVGVMLVMWGDRERADVAEGVARSLRRELRTMSDEISRLEVDREVYRREVYRHVSAGSERLGVGG